MTPPDDTAAREAPSSEEARGGTAIGVGSTPPSRTATDDAAADHTDEAAGDGQAEEPPATRPSPDTSQEAAEEDSPNSSEPAPFGETSHEATRLEHAAADAEESEGGADELIPVGDEEARIGTIVGDRYKITALLGTGGMGAVYSAEHIHMKKQVALKVLHREMTVLPEVVARFEREAIAAAHIEHPNVVQARDFGRLPDGACYLVLEYVDGESLSHVLDTEEVSIGRCLTIALQVAEALGAAHEKHIVHRDLKPDNVMLLRTASGFERVKVLDFGIAKVSIHERGRSQRPLTKMGSVFGTPEYMSPEQAAGQRVDHRADLYALGLLIYRMIAGHPPFQAESINQVLMMQITQAAPALPEAVPLPVREFVDKLLQKLPNDRFQSAEEVMSRLVEILEAVPPESLTVSVAPRREPEVPDLPQQNGMFARIGATLDQSSLGARVAVGGDSAPLWRLGIVGIVLLLLGTGLVSLLRSSGQPVRTGTPMPTEEAPPPIVPSASPPREATTPADAELEKVLAKAFTGDTEALSALEKRPLGKRSVREWLALGRGRARVEKHLGAMQAYQQALGKEPSLGRDPAVQRDVAQALKDGDSVEIALELAARYLGSAGADMLYHAWVETREVNSTTQMAKRLLQSEEVRGHASPGLEFLLEWREAMSCEDYRRLLPRALIVADTRAVTLLSRLESKNDCQLSLDSIAAAISAARGRPGPAL